MAPDSPSDAPVARMRVAKVLRPQPVHNLYPPLEYPPCDIEVEEVLPPTPPPSPRLTLTHHPWAPGWLHRMTTMAQMPRWLNRRFHRQPTRFQRCNHGSYTADKCRAHNLRVNLPRWRALTRTHKLPFHSDESVFRGLHMSLDSILYHIMVTGSVHTHWFLIVFRGIFTGQGLRVVYINCRTIFTGIFTGWGSRALIIATCICKIFFWSIYQTLFVCDVCYSSWSFPMMLAESIIGWHLRDIYPSIIWMLIMS